MRARDRLSEERRALPWVRVDKDYVFDGPSGKVTFSDLFKGRSQLVVQHFMFAPDWNEGCKSCSFWADGFERMVPHLAARDTTLVAVSRAPLEKLAAYKRRLGWTFPWASSGNTNFNYDFNVSYTQSQQHAGNTQYNFRKGDISGKKDIDVNAEAPEFGKKIAASAGTDWATFTREAPGMSAFALEDGVVYHTYSTYARGLDVLWGVYQWLDRAPKGRNETGLWMRRHDEYEAPGQNAGS